MRIASNWKFTFDPAGTPLVLLNFGDEIEAEVRFPWAGKFEIVDIVDSAAPFLRPNGNSVVTIAFTTFPSAADDKTARVNLLDALIAVEALGKKPLKIEVSGYATHYWQFANCLVGSHETLRVVESAAPRHARSYTITCTGLSKVTA